MLTKPSMRERATAGDENSAQAEKPGLHKQSKEQEQRQKVWELPAVWCIRGYEKVKREGLE